MAVQVTNYQCPTCTGPLRFDGAAGKLVCDYCDGRYDAAEIEALYADKDKAAQEAQAVQEAKKAQQSKTRTEGVEDDWDLAHAGGQWSEAEAAHIRVYTCPSCSAEIICDENTAATSCAYCGNPTVVPGMLGGALKPDLVIPFKLDKDAAIAALKTYYKGKLFLPKEFSTQNALDEIKGVYVPFWLFDCRSSGMAEFSGEKSRTYRSGDYRVTETSHFRLYRSGKVAFEKVPVDASTKMPDEHMDAIEPFDYSEIKPFSTAYLPGFLADKYDQDSKTCATRADTRIEASMIDTLAETVTGYSGVSVNDKHIALQRGKVSYALLPVWMLTTRWKDKPFTFAMNGQTGKLVGNLPVSAKRFLAWMFGIAAPMTALALAYFFLLS